ncbi:MAG: flagellar biosynthesis anti-sigma factor FlgM [Acidobacteria bacterium]|nr:flagellar biosynthesis anti-sigma factor FlgM [Acidobacteriota bacterium]MDA1236212.1 flagellar biosynthesis anti-sigma factor FlgM [Acidobacteriota bacterium]
MKIDNFTPSTDLQSTHVDKAQQTENTRSQRSGKTNAAQDSASISSLTQQISQGLQTESPERVARVEEAQKLFQSGGFNVPAAEVADSLIQSAIEDTALFSQVSGPSREA